MLQKTAPFLFAFTLFLSATLVFSVQPMLGKMMLPHVGGAPSGWAVTMFFFQTCLLVGYGLAYIFSKLPPFLNIIAILAVFLPAALFLPIAYQTGHADSISPWAVFLQLTASTALPFLALSTLAPGMQRIFSFSNHSTANDPYYLYAASNVGSFFGLLAYPLILEPLIGLQEQSRDWMYAFGVLFICVILCAICIFSTRRDLMKFKFKREPKTVAQDVTSEKITWVRRLKWIMLAAIPSSLMIGTTTQITTDIASAPLIWVIPLGLYLMTNIVAFAKRSHFKTGNLAALNMIAVFVVVVCNGAASELTQYVVIIGILYLVAFTVTAMLLHAQLANDRPNTTRLTEFYLMIALGGVLGGSFNAFIAPTIFNDVHEFSLVFILSLFLNPSFKYKIPGNLKIVVVCIIVALAVTLGFMKFIPTNFFFALIAFLLMMAAINVKALMTGCFMVLIFLATPFANKDVEYIDRNFFGVIKVLDMPPKYEGDKDITALIHGTTLHGFQAKDPELAYKPLSYYSKSGPVGDVFKTLNPKNIAVLGLGVGQIACHKKPGREFRFYEIDPNVIDVALNKFDVLKTCGHKDIILGDARLEFAKDENTYDLVVADAFSSDAIPVHLLTSEAIALYMSKLKEGGILLINISNRHINLNGVLSAVAKDLNFEMRSRHANQIDVLPYEFTSEWVIITKNKAVAAKYDTQGWRKVKTNQKPWTDDYSNIITALRLMHLLGYAPEELEEKTETKTKTTKEKE